LPTIFYVIRQNCSLHSRLHHPDPTLNSPPSTLFFRSASLPGQVRPPSKNAFPPARKCRFRPWSPPAAMIPWTGRSGVKDLAIRSGSPPAKDQRKAWSARPRPRVSALRDWLPSRKNRRSCTISCCSRLPTLKAQAKTSFSTAMPAWRSGFLSRSTGARRML